jgi:hypothetical protein
MGSIEDEGVAGRERLIFFALLALSGGAALEERNHERVVTVAEQISRAGKLSGTC